MSEFKYVPEYSGSGFLNTIFYKDEPVFVVSDTTKPFITIEDLNDMNNKIAFPKERFLVFAQFLKDQEKFFSLSGIINLSFFQL